MCACSVLLRFDKQARHGAARAGIVPPPSSQGDNATAWPPTEDAWPVVNQTAGPRSVLAWVVGRGYRVLSVLGSQCFHFSISTCSPYGFLCCFYRDVRTQPYSDRLERSPMCDSSMQAFDLSM